MRDLVSRMRSRANWVSNEVEAGILVDAADAIEDRNRRIAVLEAQVETLTAEVRRLRDRADVVLENVPIGPLTTGKAENLFIGLLEDFDSVIRINPPKEG